MIHNARVARLEGRSGLDVRWLPKYVRRIEESAKAPEVYCQLRYVPAEEADSGV